MLLLWMAGTSFLPLGQGAYGKRNRFYEEGFDFDAALNVTGEGQLMAGITCELCGLALRRGTLIVSTSYLCQRPSEASKRSSPVELYERCLLLQMCSRCASRKVYKEEVPSLSPREL